MTNRFGDIDASFQRLPPVYGYRSEKPVSIEKALEPIESLIDELPYYIKIAKKHCRFPSDHGLSKDQSAAVYIYTMEWGETTLYRVLNQALRSEDRQGLKIWFPYLKLFDTALDKLPTVKENLWRGVSLDIGKNFTKNQMLTWWSVNSCSSSVDVIKTFLGNEKSSTLFLIEAVNGKKVSGYTEYENEDEVILRIGTQFCVKSNALDHPNGSYVVHLIEVKDNDDNESMTAAMNQMHVDVNEPSNKDASGSVMATSPPININKKWRQNGVTVAGGNGSGHQLNQLCFPLSISVDDDHQCIYIADYGNDRIVEWKFGAKVGRAVADGNERGNRMDQLSGPYDVIVDKKTDSLIICDHGNRRVVRWPRQNGTKGETIISDIRCYGLTMDHDGNLYVSDEEKHEVRRWKIGEKNGTIVAGGNGKGDQLNQLDFPRDLFVDRDYSVYVSDCYNHRVMKWMKGAKEGIVVAGGQGHGDSLTQLSYPDGVHVDPLGHVYVADQCNHRIMHWSKGLKEGRAIVGGNGQGQQPNQLSSPRDLASDREGNLYVVDFQNHRVQKFEIALN